MKPWFALKALSSASVLILSAAAMPAAVLVYDGFNYTAGSSLYTQNGGTGWSGAWGSDSDGTITVNSQSSWSGATGNFVSTAPSAGTTTSLRSFSSAITTGTIYISAYMDNLNDGQRFMSIGLYDGSSERAYFGQRAITSNGVWGVYSGANLGDSSSPSWGLSSPSLLVLRIDFNDSNDTVNLRLYVDPNLSLGEPGAASASLNNITLASLSGIALGSGYTNGTLTTTNAAFDELYVTNSWASLGSVPEPGTATLLFGGLGAIWVFSRSRRLQISC